MDAITIVKKRKNVGLGSSLLLVGLVLSRAVFAHFRVALLDDEIERAERFARPLCRAALFRPVRFDSVAVDAIDHVTAGQPIRRRWVRLSGRVGNLLAMAESRWRCVRPVRVPPGVMRIILGPFAVRPALERHDGHSLIDGRIRGVLASVVMPRVPDGMLVEPLLGRSRFPGDHRAELRVESPVSTRSERFRRQDERGHLRRSDGPQRLGRHDPVMDRIDDRRHCSTQNY